MSKRKLTFGMCVPLIGGLSIGIEQKLSSIYGCPIIPKWMVSYPAFEFNDSILRRYYQQRGFNIPYIQLDPTTNTYTNENDKSLVCNVDIVGAVPPCAGLSMLNSSTGRGNSSRGSDAIQNQWMYKSTEFILGTVKPKVLFGENAPGFFTTLGEGVRNRLRLLADKYDYSYSVIKTSTLLHGIPQKRVRSFYFFWKSETCPILNYYNKDHKSIADYLSEIPKDATLQDMYLNENSPVQSYPTFEFLLERSGKTYQEFIKNTIGRFSTNETILNDDMYIEFCDWFDKKGYNKLDKTNKKTRVKTNLDRIWDKVKIRQAGGYWDDSPQFSGDHMNALISKSVSTFMNPTEERYLNVREMLHMMGLPHDFSINSKNEIPAITQNVPVNTVSDWTNEVIKFLNGELPMSNTRYLMQDNCTQRFVNTEINIESKKLF